MKINYKIVSGILAILLADYVRVNEINQKRFKRLTKSRDAHLEMITFMANKLDDSGIRMTKFDEIAYKTILEKI